MGVRLKNPNGPFPPGGYSFSDPHTGMFFDGEGVDLHSQSLRVVEHRKANPKIYNPDKPEHFELARIQDEILIQVCARQPSWCIDDSFPDRPYPYTEPPAKKEVVRIQGRKCIRCGSGDFEPVRCKTCGGSRISGYRCLSCGLEN